jgi:hypothetical protein
MACYQWVRSALADSLSSVPVDATGKTLYCSDVRYFCLPLTTAVFVTAGHYQPQNPEPDSPSDVESTESAHLGKDLSQPVKRMYPLLDLITEQGSSGLGKLFISDIPTLMTFQSTRLSSPNNLSKNSSMRSPRVLILPSRKSISNYWTAFPSSPSGYMDQKKRS